MDSTVNGVVICSIPGSAAAMIARVMFNLPVYQMASKKIHLAFCKKLRKKHEPICIPMPQQKMAVTLAVFILEHTFKDFSL